MPVLEHSAVTMVWIQYFTWKTEIRRWCPHPEGRKESLRTVYIRRYRDHAQAFVFILSPTAVIGNILDSSPRHGPRTLFIQILWAGIGLFWERGVGRRFFEEEVLDTRFWGQRCFHQVSPVSGSCGSRLLHMPPYKM